jgi:tetratricopeptide (TPR) repeat protein
MCKIIGPPVCSRQAPCADATEIVETAIMNQKSSDFFPARQAPRTTTPAAAFAQALSLHQAGRLTDAEEIYWQILAAQPAHFDSLHLLGVIFMQRGDAEAAIRQIDAALRVEPRHILALNNHGNALQQSRRFDEALASYDRALAIRADYAEALINRGAALTALRRYDEALASCNQAVELRPNLADAHVNRGNALHALHRFAEALSAFDRALALRPNYAEAHYNRGNALHAVKRHEEALASMDVALELRPDYIEALTNRGAVLHALGRDEEALASVDRALALEPNNVEALVNRGVAFGELRRHDEALACYERALCLCPNHLDALTNRGAALHDLTRFEEALASYDSALALRPDDVQIITNRGSALYCLAHFDEAMATYEHALAIEPDYPEANFNAGACRLLHGDFGGWEKFEWRWETEQFRDAKRSFPQALWLGSETIAGKTILLHAEQGLGDTIQFARYVPRVAARGARVVLEVQHPLHALMTSLPGVTQVVSAGDRLPDFDLHCPLMSLPLAFRTRLDTVPCEIPYLAAPAMKVAAWRNRLGKPAKPRIGLVWAGNPRKKLRHANLVDRDRSLAFDNLAALFEVTPCHFYSLQKGDDAVKQLRESAWRECVIDLTDDLHDFSDTAALVANLDLVISVDTSVVHLAGALGKPVWLMNRHNGCWRWLREREDTPWYPSVRQFRQDATRDWLPVIKRIALALRDYVHSIELARGASFSL